LTLSVLDLAPILQGGTAAEAFRHSLQLAQHAERRPTSWMVVSHIYEQSARLRSYGIAAATMTESLTRSDQPS